MKVDFKSGQIIKCTINGLPLIYHFGVILVEKSGVFILHNTPFYGTVIDTLDQFLSNRKIINIQNTDLVGMNNLDIYYRFIHKCFKPFDLLFYNCMDFTNCMLNSNNGIKNLPTNMVL